MNIRTSTPLPSPSATNTLSAPSRSAAAPRSAWLTPFEPIRLLQGSHVQTLAGNYWRRSLVELPSRAEAVEVDPSDGSRVLCHTHWQPEPVRSERLTLLLVHGLEGSSDSRYIRGITARAWAAGCNVIRMNMRNCGGTDEWTPTLYHSGLSGDVLAVLSHFAQTYGLQRMAMVGYSMGGNLVLKLAGELADQAPPWLAAAVAVSPAADLGASADAIHEPANRIYERHFLRNLNRRFRRKAALFPDIYAAPIGEPIRSVRDFDDRITAPYSGFLGADDYYYRAAAARVVSHIAIPTLILHALDDPFIRITPETRALMQANPAIDLVEPSRGGHCAFLARAGSVPGPIPRDRHWAEYTLVRYLMATAGHTHGG